MDEEQLLHIFLFLITQQIGLSQHSHLMIFSFFLNLLQILIQLLSIFLNHHLRAFHLNHQLFQAHLLHLHHHNHQNLTLHHFQCVFLFIILYVIYQNFLVLNFLLLQQLFISFQKLQNLLHLLVVLLIFDFSFFLLLHLLFFYFLQFLFTFYLPLLAFVFHLY